MLVERAQPESPFRKPAAGEPVPKKNAHFVRPELVCKVRFTEWTDSGGIRQPSFLGLVENADPRECIYDGPGSLAPPSESVEEDTTEKKASSGSAKDATPQAAAPKASVTNPEKIFRPQDRYTQRDLM